MNFRYLPFTMILLLFCISGYSQKYNAEVTDYTTICEVSNSGLSTFTSYTIKINNREGDKYGNFIIPYSKNSQVSGIKATITDVNGNVVRELKKSDIIDRNASSDNLYSDDFVKAFQLKHNVYPYIIKCSYKTSEKEFFSIANWSPVVDTDIPTQKASLQVITPLAYNLKVYSQKPTSLTTDTVQTVIVRQWQSDYFKLLKPEIYSQPIDEVPLVYVVPETYKYWFLGSWSSWISYGDWINNLIVGLDVLPVEEQATISSLIKGVTDKKEIVRILYHYMQDHTRYISVQIQLGGFKPYPASYVSKNKYGDCKALTNYLKAVLGFAGIESHYCLINSSEPPKRFLCDFPYQQFNHVVLAVPVDNDTIWLENTNNVNPFGYMGTSTQNRYALMIKEGESRLVKVPALAKEQVLQSNRMEYDIRQNGIAQVVMNSNYRGDEFEYMNALQNSLNENDKDRIIRRNLMFDNYEVINWKLEERARDSVNIKLNATLLLNKFLNPLGSDYFFNINPTGIPSFSNPANRTLPVVIPYPVWIEDTLIYKLPGGYCYKSQVAPIHIDTPYGKYDLEFKASEGNVIAYRTFQLYPGNYPLTTYPEFYKFIESASKAEKTKIVIKPL